MELKKKNFTSHLVLSLGLLALIAGCGEKAVTSNPDNLPQAEDLSDFGREPHSEAPDSQAGSGSDGQSALDPAAGGAATASKRLAEIALETVSKTSVPVMVTFPNTDFVRQTKADWFVGTRCQKLLEKVKATKSAPSNLKAEVPNDICSKQLIGDDTVIELVPGRYIGRTHSSGRILSSSSQTTEVLLRKDLSVSAVRERTASSGFMQDHQDETIKVAGQKGVLSQSRSRDMHLITLETYDGRLKYDYRAESGGKFKRSETSRSLILSSPGGYTIRATELSRSAFVNLLGLSSEPSIDCTIEVFDDTGTVVDRMDIDRRCMNGFNL